MFAHLYRILVLLIALTLPVAAQEPARLALLIGNEAYGMTQPGSRAVVQSKGFVPVTQENGMLIAYATAEGEQPARRGWCPARP